MWSQDPNPRKKKKKKPYNDLLSDFTATTILGKFQNDGAGHSVERVLEKLSKKKASEILAVSSVAENARLPRPYLFDRAVSAVSLPTHLSPPISRPSDCVCVPRYPVSFPIVVIQLRHRPASQPSRKSIHR